jgi:Caulimovirus viroplasmin
MPDFYYAVAYGRQTGVYTSWGEASKAVNEFPSAVYKKFRRLEDAMQYAMAYGERAVMHSRYTGPETYPRRKRPKDDNACPKEEEDDDLDNLARALSKVLISTRRKGR